MISNSKGFDCSFILGTTEFEELKSFFLSFFSNNILEDFDPEKITTKCYKYRNYVLKFSDFCYPEYILNDKHIVKTYYKRNFKININYTSITFGFEIQDYLGKSEEVSYSELYNVYKHLREHNILWFDIKPDNVVKKNEYIYVIDTEYMFKADDKNKICVKSELADLFNETYLFEHQMNKENCLKSI